MDPSLRAGVRLLFRLVERIAFHCHEELKRYNQLVMKEEDLPTFGDRLAQAVMLALADMADEDFESP